MSPPSSGPKNEQSNKPSRSMNQDADSEQRSAGFLLGLFFDHQEFPPKHLSNFNRLQGVIVQTGSGVHPTSYTMSTDGSFLGIKRPGREAEHSPPTSAEITKMWISTSTSSWRSEEQRYFYSVLYPYLKLILNYSLHKSINNISNFQ
jgi:hypothetical protein